MTGMVSRVSAAGTPPCDGGTMLCSNAGLQNIAVCVLDAAVCVHILRGVLMLRLNTKYRFSSSRYGQLNAKIY
jgi:hypothetical protein